MRQNIIKNTTWKVVSKKSHLYHKQQLEMPGWETEVAGEVC